MVDEQLVQAPDGVLVEGELGGEGPGVEVVMGGADVAVEGAK